MDGPRPLPEFLTTHEVAELLRVKERKVYDMAAAGQIPCRKVTGKLLFPRDALETWLAGESGAAAAPAPAAVNVVAGSHDPLLDWALRESGSGLATFFDGSLDGLDRMAKGTAIAAGLHVFEPDRNDWNLGHVENRLAGAPVVVIAWAERQQGLLLGQQASATVTGIADLAGLRIARRQPAAGGGLLFDHLLKDAGVASDALIFANGLARTETDAAAAVASGAADAAPGIETMARQFGLAFVPTVRERFDLVIDRRAYFEPPLQTLFAFARTDAFRAKAADLGGYDLENAGAVRFNGP